MAAFPVHLADISPSTPTIGVLRDAECERRDPQTARLLAVRAAEVDEILVAVATPRTPQRRVTFVHARPRLVEWCRAAHAGTVETCSPLA